MPKSGTTHIFSNAMLQTVFQLNVGLQRALYVQYTYVQFAYI